MIQCGNCDWWANSPIIKIDKQKNTVRKCIAKKRKIIATSESCKYFNPTYFFCDTYQQRFPYEVCLSRRRNRKNLVDYLPCKKCRQFEREIREIVNKYFIDSTPIVTPRRLEKIDRGDIQIGSGKIKRRKKKDVDKPNSKRKIKRRSKPPADKPKRKIKRRNKIENGLKYTRCPSCRELSMRENYCRVCGYKIDDLERIHNLLQATAKPKRKIKRRNK